MNNETESTLACLKQLVELQQQENKRTRALFFFILPAAIVVMVISIYIQIFEPFKHAQPRESPINWYDVSLDMRRGDLDKALKSANLLLQKVPRDFEGHYRKGEILLMLGENLESKKSFQAAYSIFPTSKYKNAVDTLALLISKDNPQEENAKEVRQ